MQETSAISRKILRELCNNSRVTVTELSRVLGMSRPIIARHIRSLEQNFKVYYTLELNYKALGLGKLGIYYIRLAEMPSDKELRNLFARNERIQLVLKTKGDFDLVIFVFEGNDEEAFAKWHLQFYISLGKYGLSASKSDIDIMHFGFMPLDSDILDRTSFSDNAKKILLTLNQNSRMSIRELAGRLGIDENLAMYHIQKLKKSGVIKRFTATIGNPQNCSNIIYFTHYTSYLYDKKYLSGINEERQQIFFKEESQLPVFNDLQMVLSLSGTEDDCIWASGNTAKESLEKIDLRKRIFKSSKPKIVYAKIEKQLKGLMPMRSLDIKSNYVSTEWTSNKT